MNALGPAFVAFVALSSACATFSAGTAATGPEDLSGTWEGQIITEGSPLNVTLNLGREQEGTMDVRHRPLKDVPIRVVNHPGPERDVVVINNTRGMPASFAGVRRGDGIQGTFTEAGRTYRFWLTRTSVAPAGDQRTVARQ